MLVFFKMKKRYFGHFPHFLLFIIETVAHCDLLMHLCQSVGLLSPVEGCVGVEWGRGEQEVTCVLK